MKNCEKFEEKTGICQKCEENYYLNRGDHRCSTTENCFESIFGVCSKCNTSYYLNKIENKCTKQEENFIHWKESLDGLTYDICDDDYYFDENGKSISIKYYTKESSELNKCEKCFSGYYLSENRQLSVFEQPPFSSGT